MQEINLDESKIKVDGQWFSAEELTQKIQDKIETGDLKISGLAQALERLSHALENSHALEIRLVLSKDEYRRFRTRGGEDDRESIRKAILSYVGTSREETQSGEVKQSVKALPDGREQAAPLNLTLPAMPKKEPSEDPSVVEKAAVVKCIKCKSPIEILRDADPNRIQCPSCSATGLLKVKDTKETTATRYQDHFLG